MTHDNSWPSVGLVSFGWLFGRPSVKPTLTSADRCGSVWIDRLSLPRRRKPWLLLLYVSVSVSVSEETLKIKRKVYEFPPPLHDTYLLMDSALDPPDVSEEDDTLAEYLEAEVLSFDSASSSDSEVSNSPRPCHVSFISLLKRN